jgi:hypothetical protein
MVATFPQTRIRPRQLVGNVQNDSDLGDLFRFFVNAEDPQTFELPHSALNKDLPEVIEASSEMSTPRNLTKEILILT